MKNIINSFFILVFFGLGTATNAQCNIFDLVATEGDCINGQYYVTVNFQYTGVGNEGFHLQGGGNNYGNFAYTALPIILGPFPGNGTSVFEFVAIDNQFPDCHDFDMAGPVSCPGGACDITDFSAVPGDCNSDGTYPLTLDFNYVNPGSSNFHVVYEGQNLGNFALSSLPIIIHHFNDNGETGQVIQVCINDSPDCCAVDEFTAPNCVPLACDVYDFSAIPGDCNSDGTYPLTLNFNYVNPGSGNFHVVYEGQNLGNFALSNLPITIQHFNDNGETGQAIQVCINDSPDCCAVDEFTAPNCVPSGGCDINDFVVTTGDCNPDGTYQLTLDFNYVNPGNDYFNVIYEGQTIETYLLSELPVTIQHFEDNGEPSQVINVCINDVLDCCAHVTFTAPDCVPGSDCHIYDVFAEAHPCNSEGKFMLDVEFNSQNTGSEGFRIKANNQLFGPFAYGQPFYTIGPLNPGVVYEIIVRDIEHEDCKGTYVFGPVFCGGDCHIYDLTATVSDCNDQGQFFVTIDFQHENTGDDGFKIYGNGNVYGYFSYNDLPVTIGPLTSDDDQLEFGAADSSHPDCHDCAVVQVPDCGQPNGGDCHIFDLVAEVHPCLPNGTFYVTLNFQHENTGGYFKVRGNGIIYGIYSYDDLPVEIGPLLGNGTTHYEFVAVDLFNEDCRDDISIGTIECTDSGDCEVHDLIVDPSDCNPDDSYNLWFWFDFENPGNNFYDVYHNNDYVGYYPLTQIPVTLPHLFANDEPLQTLKVCINDNPDCCMTIQYEAPNCDGLVWPGDGNRDNICDQFDLLNLGLAFGFEGPHRPVQGIEWTGLEAANWPNDFGNGVNTKHADCNGDGTVNQNDVSAVVENFGETNGETQPFAFLEGNETDPPLYVDLPAASAMQPGMTFTAPIMLGTVDAPLDNVYGIAFTLKFDPSIVNPASIDLAYDPSWLGVQAVNLLSFDRTLADIGEIKVALARTDQNNVSGYGQIAGIIGIIDNIAGKESIAIEIKDVKAIGENEALISLRKPVEIVDLNLNGSHEVKPSLITVYPNPARERLYFTLPQTAKAELVELYSVDGRLLLTNMDGDNKLNISSLEEGVYILKVKAGERVYQQKIVK